MNPYKAKRLICEAGKRLYDREYISGGEGNISIRIDDMIYITPTGKNKGFLNPEDIAKMDLNGNFLSKKPSSEYKMHIEFYKCNSNFSSIVHAHPTYSTIMACQNENLLNKKILLPEISIYLGEIGWAEYGTPSTSEVSSNVKKVCSFHKAFLLQNHGAVTCAEDIFTALDMMEVLEKYAKIFYLAQFMQNNRYLSDSEIQEIKRIIG